MAAVDLSTSPWLIRVIDRSPSPLFATGMLIALAYYLFTTSLQALFEPNPGGVIGTVIWMSLFAVAVFLIPLIALLLD